MDLTEPIVDSDEEVFCGPVTARELEITWRKRSSCKGSNPINLTNQGNDSATEDNKENMCETIPNIQPDPSTPVKIQDEILNLKKKSPQLYPLQTILDSDDIKFIDDVEELCEEVECPTPQKDCKRSSPNNQSNRNEIIYLGDYSIISSDGEEEHSKGANTISHTALVPDDEPINLSKNKPLSSDKLIDHDYNKTSHPQNRVPQLPQNMGAVPQEVFLERRLCEDMDVSSYPPIEINPQVVAELLSALEDNEDGNIKAEHAGADDFVPLNMKYPIENDAANRQLENSGDVSKRRVTGMRLEMSIHDMDTENESLMKDSLYEDLEATTNEFEKINLPNVQKTNSYIIKSIVDSCISSAMDITDNKVSYGISVRGKDLSTNTLEDVNEIMMNISLCDREDQNETQDVHNFTADSLDGSLSGKLDVTNASILNTPKGVDRKRNTSYLSQTEHEKEELVEAVASKNILYGAGEPHRLEDNKVDKETCEYVENEDVAVSGSGVQVLKEACESNGNEVVIEGVINYEMNITGMALDQAIAYCESHNDNNIEEVAVPENAEKSTEEVTKCETNITGMTVDQVLALWEEVVSTRNVGNITEEASKCERNVTGTLAQYVAYCENYNDYDIDDAMTEYVEDFMEEENNCKHIITPGSNTEQIFGGATPSENMIDKAIGEICISGKSVADFITSGEVTEEVTSCEHVVEETAEEAAMSGNSSKEPTENVADEVIPSDMVKKEVISENVNEEVVKSVEITREVASENVKDVVTSDEIKTEVSSENVSEDVVTSEKVTRGLTPKKIAEKTIKDVAVSEKSFEEVIENIQVMNEVITSEDIVDKAVKLENYNLSQVVQSASETSCPDTEKNDGIQTEETRQTEADNHKSNCIKETTNETTGESVISTIASNVNQPKSAALSFVSLNVEVDSKLGVKEAIRMVESSAAHVSTKSPVEVKMEVDDEEDVKTDIASNINKLSEVPIIKVESVDTPLKRTFTTPKPSPIRSKIFATPRSLTAPKGTRTPKLEIKKPVSRELTPCSQVVKTPKRILEIKKMPISASKKESGTPGKPDLKSRRVISSPMPLTPRPVKQTTASAASKTPLTPRPVKQTAASAASKAPLAPRTIKQTTASAASKTPLRKIPVPQKPVVSNAQIPEKSKIPLPRSKLIKSPKLKVGGNMLDKNWAAKLNMDKVNKCTRPAYVVSPSKVGNLMKKPAEPLPRTPVRPTNLPKPLLPVPETKMTTPKTKKKAYADIQSPVAAYIKTYPSSTIQNANPNSAMNKIKEEPSHENIENVNTSNIPVSATSLKPVYYKSSEKPMVLPKTPEPKRFPNIGEKHSKILLKPLPVVTRYVGRIRTPEGVRPLPPPPIQSPTSEVPVDVSHAHLPQAEDMDSSVWKIC